MTTPMYERAAALARAGRTPADIAADLGITRIAATRYLCYARKQGVLDPVQSRKDNGGSDTWRYLNNKGAAPPQGRLCTALDPLTRDEVLRLLDMMRPDDETLAHLVGRILKEYLDANPKAR